MMVDFFTVRISICFTGGLAVGSIPDEVKIYGNFEITILSSNMEMEKNTTKLLVIEIFYNLAPVVNMFFLYILPSLRCY